MRKICAAIVIFSSLASYASIADRKVTFKNKSTTLRAAALAQGVPVRPLDLIFQFFDTNSNKIDNQNYLTVIDFRLHSSLDRFFLVNLNTGLVESFVTAHGRGSDPDHNGMADSFSNAPQSNASSIGFYQVSETYYGKHGYSVKLDGLSTTNSNARMRDIVIHGASYVKKGLAKMGRSFGCPALDGNISTYVIDKIKEGSLLLAYANALNTNEQ